MSFLSNLFGTSAKSPGPAPTVNFSPPSFSGGGLNATFSGNGYTVAPTADRSNVVGGIQQTFNQQAGDLGSLRPMVAPGFSALRTAQLGQINNARTSALGNLRDNLARRRVLGSSFASDAIARTDQEYQNTASNTIAQTYLQELSSTQQLIQQQYESSRGAFITALNEMNLEAGIASDMTSKVSSTLASVATSNAQLAMSNQQLKAQTDMFNAGQAMKWVTGIGNMIGLGMGGGFGGGMQGFNGLSTDMPMNGSGIYTGPASIPGFG